MTKIFKYLIAWFILVVLIGVTDLILLNYSVWGQGIKNNNSYETILSAILITAIIIVSLFLGIKEQSKAIWATLSVIGLTLLSIMSMGVLTIILIATWICGSGACR